MNAGEWVGDAILLYYDVQCGKKVVGAAPPKSVPGATNADLLAQLSQTVAEQAEKLAIVDELKQRLEAIEQRPWSSFFRKLRTAAPASFVTTEPATE